MLGLNKIRLDSLKRGFQNLASSRSEAQMEGERLLDQGEWESAEQALARALVDGARRQLFSIARIGIYLELAEAQRQQFHGEDGTVQPRKLQAAEDNCRAALDLARKGSDRTVLVQCLDALSETIALRGDLEAVEVLTSEAVQAEQFGPPADPAVIAKRFHRLANLRRECGRVILAVPALEQALQATERLRGPVHLETADLLMELGDVYRYLGHHEQAQTHLKRALDVHERECGLWSAEAAHDLNLLTGSYEASGHLKLAAAEHERVLTLKQRGVGTNMEGIAESQFDLAHLYVRWGNLPRARELLMEVVGTFKRSRAVRLAMAHEALADIEQQEGHLRGALQELLNACHVWEQLPVEHTRELCRNLGYQVQVYEALRQREDAAFVRQRLAALDRATGWAAAS